MRWRRLHLWLFAYPLLFALFPGLHLVLRNTDRVSWLDVLGTTLVLLLAALGLVGGLVGLSRNRLRGPLLASWCLLWMFAYGPLISGLAEVLRNPTSYTWHPSNLTIKWSLVGLATLLAFMIPRSPRTLLRMNRMARTFGVVLCASALTGLFQEAAPGETSSRTSVAAPSVPGSASAYLRPKDASGSALPAVAADDRPDFYFLIPDAYPRFDVLAEVYHHRTGVLAPFLRSRGFFVAERSLSNYPVTRLSVPSTLDMRYFVDLARPTAFDETDVPRFFSARGYENFRIFSSGHMTEGPSRRDDEAYLHGLHGSFAWMLLRSTPLPLLGSRLSLFDQRSAVETCFRRLDEIVSRSGPKFVFFHVMAPHKPFVFQREGGIRETSERLNARFQFDALGNAGPLEEILKGQIDYTDARLCEVIDRILAKPGRPKVILLQSDHGLGRSFHLELLDRPRISKRELVEAFANLCAVRVTTGNPSELYATITPVNAFRVLLSHVFGVRYPLLPDRQIWIPHNGAVVDVTGILSAGGGLSPTAPTSPMAAEAVGK